MKKRILSILLSLALGLAMMPIATGITFANTHEHSYGEYGLCTCGEWNKNLEKWTKWTNTDSLPSLTGNYYLDTDITLTAAWPVSTDTNLCLNGHYIKQTGTNQYVITVSGNAILNIYDCNSTEHYGHIDETTNLWVLDTEKKDNNVSVYGGCITGGNYADGYGAGINIQSGTVSMYGGTICGNRGGTFGGGIYMKPSSGDTCIFNLYGV